MFVKDDKEHKNDKMLKYYQIDRQFVSIIIFQQFNFSI